MPKTIYLLNNFNNYYNRIIKRYDSVLDYVNHVGEGNYAIRGNGTKIPRLEVGGSCNFNINDGITAEITHNYDENQPWQPDYVVITEYGSLVPSSRWFVIEASKTRQGQYSISLRRDVISDFYNTVIDAPTFIEKATLNKTSPFIFNPENMTYNQIKSEQEILLKDETQVPWIVGYMATPQTPVNGEKFTGDNDVEGYMSEDVYETVNSLDDLPFKIYSGQSGSDRVQSYNISNSYIQYLVNKTDGLGNNGWTIKSPYSDPDGGVTVKDSGGYIPPIKLYWKSKSDNTSTIKGSVRLATFFSDATAIRNLMRSAIESTGKLAESVLDGYVRDYNGKVIYNKEDNEYYHIIAEKKESTGGSNITITSSTYPELYNKVDAIASSSFEVNSSSGNKSYTLGGTTGYYYYFKIESSTMPIKTVKTSISNTRRTLKDSPYCMFAIPADTFTFKDKDSSNVVCDKDFGFGAARAISEKYSGTFLYDLQLLPYFPRRDMLLSDGTLSLESSNLQEGVDFEYIKDALNNKKSVIIWCNRSYDNLQIPVNISVPDDSIEFKIESETTFYRLSSPNYAAQYEFSAAKNYGIDFVDVDLAYKPYTPYIHANINFKGLYGADTNDTRGLICSGDFSLPQTADQWAQYELNNKNYQNSFNRQIENMKFTHKWDMVDSGISAITSAAGVGVTAGIAAGPAAGLGAGALSLGAGIADQVINQEKFNETINYTKDQFGFELGNVKARPDTLSKVSAFNPNNKVFLFIEKYTCTDEEKVALRNKLYYNGMSVGVIGKISDYIQEEETYIKGKIIRLEGLSDDYHISSVIAEELNKGVFIK